MKHKFFWAALLLVITVGILAACSQTAATPSTEKSEAEILIDERCSPCHSANKVYSENLTQEQWSAVFDDMIAKGAEVNDAEKTLMIDWLVSGN
jgi:Spy/CpxP family protein refolding chaperone